MSPVVQSITIDGHCFQTGVHPCGLGRIVVYEGRRLLHLYENKVQYREDASLQWH